MTKKHFEAIANYLAEAKRTASNETTPFMQDHLASKHQGAYEFALYLCNKFGQNFDRQRFDDWIERKSKAS